MRFFLVKAKRMIPEQLLRYQKKMKLEQQLAEAKTSIEAKKKQFTDLSTAMKNKSKLLFDRIQWFRSEKSSQKTNCFQFQTFKRSSSMNKLIA